MHDCSDCKIFKEECRNCPLLYPRAQCKQLGCYVVEWCERVGCPVLKENLKLDRYWGWDVCVGGEENGRCGGEHGEITGENI